MGVGAAIRIVVWLVHVTLPAIGLWLLVSHPTLDAHYEHHGVHFWLVLATASIAMVLGIILLRAARLRADARLILVSLVFQFNAGFLALHALATPGIILQTPNAGFVAATPVGLVLGGVAALASAIDYGPVAARRIHRFDWAIAALPFLALTAWAITSLAQLPPLDRAPDPTEAHGPLVVAAFVGSALYLTAAVRYLRNYIRTRGIVLLSVLTAFVLLSEALFAVGFGRSWRASWWEWHLLMVAAFTLIVVSAHTQFRREGSALGLFDSVTLRQTVAALERDYAHALEAVVDALRQRADGGVSASEPLGAVGVELSKRFGLTERQVAVLAQSGRALGNEREQVRRLGALVAVGERSSVIAREADLLAEIRRLAAAAFEPDIVRIGVLRSGRMEFDDAMKFYPAALHLPLLVKGKPAGVLEVHRRTGQFTDAEVALLRSFASQTSVALENARLYQQLDGLFRSYMSPAVATALLADPSQAGLGGEITEVSILFADLRGFTPFSERSTPDQVVAMLNTYYGAIVPVILAEGGTVVQFVGDAVMALFNAPTRQPDHALRAARAGLGLHRAIEQVATSAEWPRFRVGVNTGPALVGNVGSAQMRNFTAIGDTTNLAARLEGLAEPGTVVIGPLTRAQLGDRARVRSRGEIQVKGRREPVVCYVLEGLL
ncbi:adenylate/guanylate cyclase domain-containing protein [Antrihabitans sp. YC2-6]|uniref:adenylate/guanylate cyclase domain-containing protein n=1 Tax=Antrihabitans sp. YC2-6 TaxID=2799498 RepID=UPI0018F5DB85|nr:adenylate/guanylate cyclase domain-containing protein [Antrihabitans sp. YC2-6]MBJ8346226.1 GAF domain-containing protein [Antrihabitans sp. YC2-6]